MNDFRHIIRLSGLLLLFAVGFLPGEAAVVYPESLETVLASMDSDSALELRAELAYSRGLYQTARDLAERVGNSSQKAFFILGQCNHVLAKPYAARGFFAMIDDSFYLPLARLGLAEIYCYDVIDGDSCRKYMALTEEMDYLGRYVELRMPDSLAPEAIVDGIDSTAGAWTLQFGAFGMRSLAEQMAIKVRGEGIRSWIVPIEREGKKLFFVYGGTFVTKGEAAARADALAKEFATKVVGMPEVGY